MKTTTIGLDLAKNIIQVHGADPNGKKLLVERVPRSKLLGFLALQPPCQVGMESTCGAHYWAREIEKLGHQVRIISPKYVKPFVLGNKTDKGDAEAIVEAMQRNRTLSVPVKSEAQQELQILHRIRERRVRQMVQVTNQLRGLLGEYGHVGRPGRAGLQNLIESVLALPYQRLRPRIRLVVMELSEALKELESFVAKDDKRLMEVAKSDELCQRLMKVPGIGVITATALVSSVGNAHEFRNGRQFSSWLGLVPSEFSSGEKQKLGGITKRGNVYLRALLVHGARSVLAHLHRREDRLGEWIKRVKERRGSCKAIVALANKLGRIVWVLMAKGEQYSVACR
jgi:transposase